MCEIKRAECGTPRVACRTFTFEDSGKDAQERLSVFIPEVVDAQYGTYVWPSAVVLAQYVWSRRLDLKEQTVLELGAGVSLPGVVAAKCGAKIILSDDANTLLWQHTCKRSCDANNLHEVLTLPLTWGDISSHLALLAPLHLILGSDVFYEPADFEDILVTVVFLLQKNPTAEFWMTYQDRSADWTIEALLHKWKLTCVHVDLESFDANKCELAGSSLPGNHNIQMILIRLCTDQEM